MFEMGRAGGERGIRVVGWEGRVLGGRGSVCTRSSESLIHPFFFLYSLKRAEFSVASVVTQNTTGSLSRDSGRRFFQVRSRFLRSSSVLEATQTEINSSLRRRLDERGISWQEEGPSRRCCRRVVVGELTIKTRQRLSPPLCTPSRRGHPQRCTYSPCVVYLFRPSAEKEGKSETPSFDA